MVEALKSFGIGLGVIVAFAWAIYALLFAIISLFTVGAATFAVMPVWSWVLASIPWAALVVCIIAVIGDAIRNSR